MKVGYALSAVKTIPRIACVFSIFLSITACAPTRPNRYLGASEAKLQKELGEPVARYETEDGLRVLRYLQIATLGRGQYVREPLERKEDRSLWRQCRDNGGGLVECSVNDLALGGTFPFYLWGEEEKEQKAPESRYRYTRTITYIVDPSGKVVFWRGKDPIYGEWYRPENEFGEQMLARLHEIEAKWREQLIEQSPAAEERPKELPPAFTVPPPETKKNGR